MNIKRTSGSFKRTLLIVLSVVLAVVLVVLIVGTAYMESLLNLIKRNPDDSTLSSDEYNDFINNTETMDPEYTGETLNPDDVDWNNGTLPAEKQEHIINFMLIGQDRLPGEPRQRSDVMILCTINTSTKEVTMTSFMRDMYVPIPGYKDNKMNATYSLGGMKLLSKCMETNFGVYVDGSFEVDFDHFVELIDLVGGVDVYLSNSEAKYLIGKGFQAHAGLCHLDGAAALQHSRNRDIGNSDFSRTERQREVLGALLDKCRDMSFLQLKKLVEKALPMLTTDLTNREILNYMGEILPIVGELKVQNMRIPADGTFYDSYISGVGSVLVPDLEANRKLLEESMAKTP